MMINNTLKTTKTTHTTFSLNLFRWRSHIHFYQNIKRRNNQNAPREILVEQRHST